MSTKDCPKCGREMRQVRLPFRVSPFTSGWGCLCGHSEGLERLSSKPSFVLRLLRLVPSVSVVKWRWHLRLVKLHLPVVSWLARPTLYTEVVKETPKKPEEKPKTAPAKVEPKPRYETRRRGWKHTKGFKLGGRAGPANRKVRTVKLPLPMPKVLLILLTVTLPALFLHMGHQYVSTLYGLPSPGAFSLLAFFRSGKRCALCKGPISVTRDSNSLTVIKGESLRFCSKSHEEIFSDKHKRAEYDAIQRQTRRDFVKVTAGVAGAGVLAGLLGGIGIGRSEAQSGGKKDPEVISSGPGGQVGTASVIVFQDSSGNNYAIDRGAGLSSANGLVGELLVKANVTTTYYNTLTGNAAGVTTTTAGIMEAIKSLPQETIYPGAGSSLTGYVGGIYFEPGQYVCTQPISVPPGHYAFVSDVNSGYVPGYGYPNPMPYLGGVEIYLKTSSYPAFAIQQSNGLQSGGDPVTTLYWRNIDVKLQHPSTDQGSTNAFDWSGLVGGDIVSISFLDDAVAAVGSINATPTIQGIVMDTGGNLDRITFGTLLVSGFKPPLISTNAPHVTVNKMHLCFGGPSTWQNPVIVVGSAGSWTINTLHNLGHQSIYGVSVSSSNNSNSLTGFTAKHVDFESCPNLTNYLFFQGTGTDWAVEIDQMIIAGTTPWLAATSIASTANTINVFIKKFSNMITSAGPAFGPLTGLSLATNPPVTGTTYQNTFPFPIKIAVPITLNPTSAAAATAYLRVGSSSTAGANSIKDQCTFPAGLTTADGAIYTLKYVVPPGYYYEVDVTNATIGTAQADEAE